MDQDPAVVTVGNGRIAAHLKGYTSLGFQLASAGTPIQLGCYVAENATWSGGGGVPVSELDRDGKISHRWVTGGTP